MNDITRALAVLEALQTIRTVAIDDCINIGYQLLNTLAEESADNEMHSIKKEAINCYIEELKKKSETWKHEAKIQKEETKAACTKSDSSEQSS